VLLGAPAVSLVLGLPLPEALNLRFRLQELLLLGAGCCVRGSPLWVGLGVVVVLLVAGSVLAMPLPVPLVSSVLGRVLTGGGGLLVAILVVVGLVVPTLRGRRPGRGASRLASGGRSGGDRGGFRVRGAAGACGALGSAGPGWPVAVRRPGRGNRRRPGDLRASRPRPSPQEPSVPGVRPCGRSWRVAWRPWRRPSS